MPQSPQSVTGLFGIEEQQKRIMTSTRRSLPELLVNRHDPLRHRSIQKQALELASKVAWYVRCLVLGWCYISLRLLQHDS